MSGDEVLPALRRHRDEFARAHGYDLASMTAFLREMDRAAGERVICRAAKPPVATLDRNGTSPNPPLTQTGAA